MFSSLEGKKEKERDPPEREWKELKPSEQNAEACVPRSRFTCQLTRSTQLFDMLAGLEEQTFCIVPKDRTGKVEGGKREVEDKYKEGLCMPAIKKGTQSSY